MTSKPFSDKNSGIGREKLIPTAVTPVYDAGLRQVTDAAPSSRAATGKIVPKRQLTCCLIAKAAA
jgi:hypothetical protein